MFRRTVIVGVSVLALAGLSVDSTVARSVTGRSSVLDVGDRAVPVSSVRMLPGGGTEYDYVIDGIVNRALVPPVGFDPDQAGADQLREYGYAPKPKDRAGLAVWERAAHVKRVDHPGPVIATTIHNAQRSSPIWSGYEMLPPDPDQPFTNAIASFRQPTYQPTCPASARTASWVGIGGDNPSFPALIQAGTVMENGTYRAVYEYLNRTTDSGAITLPLTVPPGDQMDVFVSFDTTTDQVLFEVSDESNGTGQSMTVNLDETYWDGTTADFIDERPTVNHVVVPLADFGDNDWSNVSAQDTNGTSWNLGDAGVGSVQMNMVNSSRLVLAEPSVNNGNTFTDTWVSCQ